MVYGRILYNNIKEYTPKWFGTIPYSQTVKPVFGIELLTKAANPKLCQHSILPQLWSRCGGTLHSCSNATHGLGKSSSLAWPLCSSTSWEIPSWPSTRQITPIGATKPPSPRRRPTKRRWENSKKPKKLPKPPRNDPLSRIYQIYLIIQTIILAWLPFRAIL